MNVTEIHRKQYFHHLCVLISKYLWSRIKHFVSVR